MNSDTYTSHSSYLFPGDFTIMASSNVHRNLTQITGWTPHIFAIGFAFLLHSFLKWLFFRRSMPPGPLGVPLIGNYQQLPSVKPWLKFSEWTRQYGRFYSFNRRVAQLRSCFSGPVISLFLGSTSVIGVYWKPTLVMLSPSS